MFNFKFLIMFVAVLSLFSCVQQPKKSDGTPIYISDVKANPDAFRGKQVRWAGNIVSVKNTRAHTIVEVLGKKLSIFGSANDTGVQQGRFFAKFAGFKDPAQYSKGRLLLVNGIFNTLKNAKIGEHNYVYPEVVVSSHKLSDRPYNTGYGGSSWRWGLGWGWGSGGHSGGHVGVGWGY